MGLSIAFHLKKLHPEKRIVLIEKEGEPGAHASGRNSGVLHAGFYYSPDTFKAKFTRLGNEALTRFCEERGLRINRCGKVVVARSSAELETLYELKRRGDLNGVELYLVDEKELKDIEPHARTCGYALFSPRTSVVDPLEVLKSLQKELEAQGVEFYFHTPYKKKLDNNAILAGGFLIEYSKVYNCAGLYADRIARDFGLSQNFVLVPFKGIYLECTSDERWITRNIYPVPDIRNPFLGVHFTVKVDGKVKIGPTATPCFWRENYQGFANFQRKEFLEISAISLRLFINNPLFRQTAFQEMKKYIKRFLLKEAERLVDSLGLLRSTRRGKPGIRAQLVDLKKFQLVQDFVVEHNNASVHILNAVSPAFTASFPFARYIIENH
jgi:L-2-hydroxyglutarate oxidase LhgO